MVDKRWYTTVGVPGGEFACQAPSHTQGLAILMQRELQFWPEEELGKVAIRLANPELAEWLDAATGGQGLREEGSCGVKPDSRWKVPGGWLYFGGAGASASAAFVPVAGAAGITVIGEKE